jgi:uncharacterized protein with FMN-binding domain
MPRSNVKPLAALVLTGIGSALVAGFQVPASSVATTTGATTTGAAATTTAAAAGTTSGASTTTASATQYADGTWTGTAVSEPWGTFQVQAVVSGGTITNVVVVASPQDGHSSRINSQAIPVLTQAVIAAQGAEVDAVSGATWTSQSYLTSLQAALDQAAAAVQTVG